MDYREITKTWLHSMGLVKQSGPDTLEPLMPVLLMDTMYEFYHRDIEPLELAHKCQLYRSRWYGAYDRFIKDFFKLYNEGQQLELVCKMEDFGAYIWNWCVMARLEVMKLFPDVEMSRRQVIASALLCDYLVKSARAIWEKLFASVGMPDNPRMAACSKWAMEFVNQYRGKGSQVDLEKCPEVLQSVRQLCNKIVQFIRDDYEADL